MSRVLLLLLSLGLAGVTLTAADWPQFRGPTGQGVSDESGVPLEWSESRNIAWKVPVPGIGWSSPAVSGGRVWLTTMTEAAAPRRGAQSLRALAFDVATGKLVVNTEVFSVTSPEPMHQKNSRASPTPIVSGDRVYVHYGSQGTAALSTSGEVLWKTRLAYESQHGNGGSPVLYRDLLIVVCDGNGGDAYVAALDVQSGKIRWKTDRRRPADQAYATPLVIRVGDRDQLVAPGAYRAAAYDPSTGKEIWRVSYADGFSNVPRPVFAHGLVYIATGFNTPSLIAVRPDGTGDVTRSHLAWTVSRGAPYTPSPIVAGDALYYVSDTGVLSAADARTGALLFQHRLSGNYSASPVLADGRLYFSSEEGVTTVVSPGKAFQQLAVNRLDGSMLASLAVSNGSIFARTDTSLYRIASNK